MYFQTILSGRMLKRAIPITLVAICVPLLVWLPAPGSTGTAHAEEAASDSRNGAADWAEKVRHAEAYYWLASGRNFGCRDLMRAKGHYEKTLSLLESTPPTVETERVRRRAEHQVLFLDELAEKKWDDLHCLFPFL